MGLPVGPGFGAGVGQRGMNNTSRGLASGMNIGLAGFGGGQMSSPGGSLVRMGGMNGMRMGGARGGSWGSVNTGGMGGPPPYLGGLGGGRPGRMPLIDPNAPIIPAPTINSKYLYGPGGNYLGARRRRRW